MRRAPDPIRPPKRHEPNSLVGLMFVVLLSILIWAPVVWVCFSIWGEGG